MLKITPRFLFLVTVRNRKALSLSTLSTLVEFSRENSLNSRFVVVDDGSNDGTADAIMNLFPEIQVLQGDGSLFWAGGMRLGFEHIKNEGYGYDFLVAFNDDIFLEKKSLLRFFSEFDKQEITVGAFQSSSGELSYGGRDPIGWWPLNFGPISRDKLGQHVTVANFNFILIPHQVLTKINLIDDYFIHNSADYDFSLRAKRNGFLIRMSSVILGRAERNPIANTSADSSLRVITRARKLLSAKEYPVRQRFLFCKSHGRKTWFLWFLRPYFGFLFRLVR